MVISCIADEGNDYYLEPPCLIIEVASDSTVRKDYLEKSLAYLQAYLIVAQDKLQVDMLYRLPDNSWGLQQFDQLEDEIALPCLDYGLTLTSIYANVLHHAEE